MHTEKTLPYTENLSHDFKTTHIYVYIKLHKHQQNYLNISICKMNHH